MVKCRRTSLMSLLSNRDTQKVCEWVLSFRVSYISFSLLLFDQVNRILVTHYTYKLVRFQFLGCSCERDCTNEKKQVQRTDSSLEELTSHVPSEVKRKDETNKSNLTDRSSACVEDRLWMAAICAALLEFIQKRERGKDDAFSEHKLVEDLFIREYLFSHKDFSTSEEEMLD